MIVYIFKSSLSLIILFGLYWFLLRKEKLFVFNRYFLIASVVFSLVVPFISIPVNFRVTPQINDIIPASNYAIPEISSPDNIITSYADISQSSTVMNSSAIRISTILLALYISGIVLFLIRFLKNLYMIIRKSKLSEKINLKGYQIVLTNDTTSPCCFFTNIFLNREDYLNGRIDKELLEHELEHARQSHTIDIILIELVKIFYWFNPVHVLYNRAIRINHEYLADNGVISDNPDLKSYADKILNFITRRGVMSLTSGSNHSFTKMRLMMLMKSRSGSFIYGARIAMTLCMGTAVFLLLSFKESGKLTSSPTLSEPGTEVIQSSIRGIVMTEDGKPLFGATISITGSNNTSLQLITGTDGSFIINDIQPGALLLIEFRGFKGQTVKPDFASEMIIRLVRDPDFKGNVVIPEIQDVNFRNLDFTPAKALVVIDGVILDNKGELKVNPDKIKSIKILKYKAAITKYGDRGNDGVVEIILYGNKTESGGKKPLNRAASDTTKYQTLLSVNHASNKGELIDIPVSNLQYIGVWTYHDIDKINKKELRTISIMTRDYYIVKGRVVHENGEPLSGVKISATDKPVPETSDKEGRFVIEDVRDGAMLEFSLQGYKTYYLSTSFGVAFNTELTVKLEKAKNYRGQNINGNQRSDLKGIIASNFNIKNKNMLPVYEKPELFPINKSDYSEMSRSFGEKRAKISSQIDTAIFHYGIDIEAKYGTEVIATAGGKVIKASWDGKGYGNLIEIDHGGGYQSRYAHLKDFNVKNGDTVIKGQTIGHVGNSGISTGPHLHFEIRSNGETVNPMTYLK